MAIEEKAAHGVRAINGAMMAARFALDALDQDWELDGNMNENDPLVQLFKKASDVIDEIAKMADPEFIYDFLAGNGEDDYSEGHNLNYAKFEYFERTGRNWGE